MIIRRVVLSAVIYSFFFCSGCRDSSTGNDGIDATLAEGLVAYYPFDGNANDLSGQGHQGTVIGAVLSDDRFGKPNSAYYFNGSSSYINLGDILDEVFSKANARFSVSGWAKTVTPGSVSKGGGFIIGKSGGGTAGVYEWGINHYADNNVYANIFFDGYVTRFVQVTSSPVRSGPWFHFVYVFDGSLPSGEREKLYINASIDLIVTQQIGSPGTGTLNTTQPLTIGAGFNLPNNPNNYYNGYLDDIRIYNRPLTLKEIQALYVADR
jgi:hypothetical protein